MTNHTTREAWLHAAVAELNVLFQREGYDVPDVKVSVGWPHGGRKNTIGQCFPGGLAGDGIGQVFISPILDDAVRILDVLLHELVHAINHTKGENGHGKPFSTIAKKVGLTGKMTATVASDELKVELEAIAQSLGTFPHSALGSPVAGSTKSRSGKSIKLACAHGEDFVVSISKARLESFGAPQCPCHDDSMEVA
ncbi:SprT-like protease [Microbacterium phage Vitas]|uniref:SprT-like protease n=3 Tax=Armstrongvirus armstrong TaxID=2734217 RepID=A0A3G2KDD9_9CAUD|nr:SprT-like protease [Microbacterium phage Bernstein]AYN58969.1 SprT-like protease [Microbacterium phage Rollins]QED11468.1 SprT-like protease [Microbacterium phage Vitas]UGL62012.1 SprT-like protease [Microbacterium phage Skylord]UOK18199.1 SprT-like protease [Microbacterium phage Clayda5]